MPELAGLRLVITERLVIRASGACRQRGVYRRDVARRHIPWLRKRTLPVLTPFLKWSSDALARRPIKSTDLETQESLL